MEMKRWLISKVVTPRRARKLIALALSWVISKCIVSGTWDSVSTFPSWLRRLADFIDEWNSTQAPDSREQLLADLVADAVTDEQVDRLIDTITAMEAKRLQAQGKGAK